MAVSKSPKKKLFTVGQANATLPLVRRIVRDITELAQELRARQDSLARLRQSKGQVVDKAHAEEIQHVVQSYEQEQLRLAEYLKELQKLGVELKDFFLGLVDFPCQMDNRLVYLCWRLGEPEVTFWHEIDAGYAGRQKLGEDSALLT